MKTMLKFEGTTADGHPVVSHVYRAYETIGVPLDVLFSILKDRQIRPCWMSFYQEARAAGMKHDRILAKLEEALNDVWGLDYQKAVVARLAVLFGQTK